MDSFAWALPRLPVGGGIHGLHCSDVERSTEESELRVNGIAVASRDPRTQIDIAQISADSFNVRAMCAGRPSERSSGLRQFH